MMRIIRKLRYPFEYIFILLFLNIILFLPYRALVFIAHIIARFIYYASFATRKLILTNLKMVFTEKSSSEIKKLALASLKSMILTSLEFNYFFNNVDEFKQMLDENEDLWSELKSKSQEKGLIIVTLHLGNWELANLAMNTHNLESAVVARRARNPYLNKFINANRSKFGTKVILEKGAAKGLLQSLRKKIPIAMLIDQNIKPRRGGELLDFFGLKASTSRAVATFVAKGKANIVMSALVRENNRFKMIQEKLPENINSLNEVQITQEILKGYERMIKKYPEQWMWAYKRWLYIPENNENIEKYPYYARKI